MLVVHPTQLIFYLPSQTGSPPSKLWALAVYLALVLHLAHTQPKEVTVVAETSSM